MNVLLQLSMSRHLFSCLLTISLLNSSFLCAILLDMVCDNCVQAPLDNDLMSVLGSLPGVNPDDPALQTALRNLQGGSSDKPEEKKDAK